MLTTAKSIVHRAKSKRYSEILQFNSLIRAYI